MDSNLYRDNPINSIRNLLAALDISESEYEKFLITKEEDRYHRPHAEAFKKDGSVRKVYCPCKLTRKFQRRLNNRIFKKSIVWPPYVFGSIPIDVKTHESKDYIKCAAMHCKSKSLLKLDISDFFDNIDQYHVVKIFTEAFSYHQEVADFISKICCFKGHLVQGALTSSYVANLIFYDLEPELVKSLSRKNLTYTRFIDDITVSSKVSHYNFSSTKRLIEDMLLKKNLPLNEQKVEVLYSSTKPLMVHGLRVDFSEPRLPSKEVANIRAELNNLKRKAKEKKYRKSRSYRKSYDKCLGRVNKLARVKHSAHAKFKPQLKEIQPLPSAVDIKLCHVILKKLASFPDDKRESYWYKKRFNQLVYLNGIIKRLYPKSYSIIKEKSKELEPKSRVY
ncbi:reverse transcriptase family protein [Pseudoalteromonas luteoviolacea]|uniref:reverse transcriptase family protein n=1 Tax=Pseudoalteromonas luteoviolacea TaxID=43657 RepID=UPI001B38EC96|nr:reverse transcriptase family protein [Pseudoalteromonas luteoviolacea]MBQ4836812.1 RNA-directed DNA polymerase [Pseudoalteromonas luteoviolacea]